MRRVVVLVLVVALLSAFAIAAATEGRHVRDPSIPSGPSIPADLQGYAWWWVFESTPRGWERWDGPYPAQNVCEILTDDYRQEYPRRTFECRM